MPEYYRQIRIVVAAFPHILRLLKGLKTIYCIRHNSLEKRLYSFSLTHYLKKLK